MAIFDNIDTFSKLESALNTANGNGEADTINITGDITLTNFLPLIAEDVSLTINGDNYRIDGNNQFRLFFVETGVVTFNTVNFFQGLAAGGGWK